MEQSVMDRISKYKTGKWFRAYSVDEMEMFFKSRIPIIRATAKECGYAIGVHGSMRRDLDLMAMPWVDDHKTPDELAKSIMMAACGIKQDHFRWTQKPNGRIAVSIPICWPEWEGCHDILSLGMIDLSVMVGGK